MHRLFLCLAAVVVASSGVLVPRVGLAAPLIGSSGGTNVANIYDVNTTTGAATNPRSTGINYLCGITANPTGQVYGLTTFASSPPNALVKINPATGIAITVGLTGLSNIFEGDLDFQPNTGKLYGIQDVTNGYRIFQMNPSTGAAIADVAFSGGSPSDLSAMAFAPDGTCYIIDTGVSGNSALLTVNPDTGAILSNRTMNVDLGATAGMDFDPDTGKLYVADGGSVSGPGNDHLYTLNLGTATLSAVGPLGLNTSVGLGGLTFLPEPTSGLTLLCAMLFGVGGVRGRRACSTAR